MGNEFGLGAVAMASIVETHPERYVRLQELDADCAGDEFAPSADSGFSQFPFFFFGGGLEFLTRCVSGVNGGFGSVSDFVRIDV